MQLTEFLDVFALDCEITDREHPHFVPSFWRPHIIEAAKSGQGWSAQESEGPFYPSYLPKDYNDLLGDIRCRLGGVCAWVNGRGHTFPVSYSGHCFAAEALIAFGDVSAERRMAHITLDDRRLTRCTEYVVDAKVTDKMIISTMRFCYGVRRLPEVTQWLLDHPEHPGPYAFIEDAVETHNATCLPRYRIEDFTQEQIEAYFKPYAVRHDVSEFTTIL